jgi:chromosome segregation protein
LPAGAVRLSSVVRLAGEHQAAVRDAIGEAIIVESFEQACELAARSTVPVATLDGDVVRGSRLVAGGGKTESRGILATKREIKELRERVGTDGAQLDRLSSETAEFEASIAHATAAVAALAAELHRQEKDIVGVEAQLQRATEDETRLTQRRELVATETRRVAEEIEGLDARQSEARESIARLGEQRAAADALLSEMLRQLGTARETSDQLAQRAADARATHAALVERSAGVAADVRRLEDAARELERRVETCASDLTLMRDQRERLLVAVAEGHKQVDADVLRLDEHRETLRQTDDKALGIKTTTDQQEELIRDARRALDAVRALAAEFDVTRATAESDLSHLSQQCFDAVNLPLDEVRAEVERMEAEGVMEPDAATIRAAETPEPDEEEEPSDLSTQPEDVGEPASVDRMGATAAVRMTAEDAIAELRGKIDKLGPVNMMAIEQFTELDQRHSFLTTQRKDLVDSIAQTNEAIKRIDETTHARFRDAFSAINANFQQTFSTLFGGGRAGITLLDDTDPLESGIDIVASPPGKRLQNVMLLSGGEKALTAIALMFAIFRYKPSPFCVLDEIDAPLDDANIGRFVEMLRAMLDRTQFIIITHNRKTMEIADRLYGVTMEEPGVSKLISIQLN